MSTPKSTKEYPDSNIFMDKKRRLFFAPLVRNKDETGAAMYRQAILLEKPYDVATIGKTAKECLSISDSHNFTHTKNLLRLEDLPTPIKEKGDKGWKKFHYNWYTITLGEWPQKYEIRPWKRDGVMDAKVFELSLDVSDKDLGIMILDAFDYIDQHFGFDKYPPKD